MQHNVDKIIKKYKKAHDPIIVVHQLSEKFGMHRSSIAVNNTGIKEINFKKNEPPYFLYKHSIYYYIYYLFGISFAYYFYNQKRRIVMKKSFKILMTLFVLLFITTSANAGLKDLKKKLSNATKKLVELPKNTSSKEYKSLGYVQAHDTIIKKDYAFLIYKESDLNKGSFVIRIKSNVVTGTVLDQPSALKNAQKANKEGKKYFTMGRPFSPAGALDKRVVEYRFYQKNGKPDSIEVYVVTRNKKRNANKPKTAKASWPKK